jgi:hypothetical protein
MDSFSRRTSPLLGCTSPLIVDMVVDFPVCFSISFAILTTRRLTCTVGTEQRENFTSRHTESDSIDSKVVAVSFADVAYAQLVLTVVDSDRLAIHVFISVLAFFRVLRAGLYLESRVSIVLVRRMTQRSGYRIAEWSPKSRRPSLNENL